MSRVRPLTMEEMMIQEIKRRIPALLQIVSEVRPNADRGSVEVSAAVALLISTIFMLNVRNMPDRLKEAVDEIVMRLPRNLVDRQVSIDHAVLDPACRAIVTAQLRGANLTNVLGAFEAIYNARIASDFAKISEMRPGSFGAYGGMAVITSDLLFGRQVSSVFPALLELYRDHYQALIEIVGREANRQNEKPEGRKECFVATACFESSDSAVVKTLRQFREAVLKRYPLGRKFVLIYYRTSPTFANAVRRNELLRIAASKALSLTAAVLRRAFGLD